MSNADPNVAEQQRRYREFLDLMPLTIAFAGLPTSDTGKYYTEEQMETRAFATYRPVIAFCTRPSIVPTPALESLGPPAV